MRDLTLLIHAAALRELSDATWWYDQGDQGRHGRFRTTYPERPLRVPKSLGHAEGASVVLSRGSIEARLRGAPCDARPPGDPRVGRRRQRGRDLLAGVLTGLKKRGLGGVQLVISDQHCGLVAALTRVFQGSAHQRCRVRNIGIVLAHVPKAETEMVAAVFRTIFAQPDLASMAKQWDKVRDDLTTRYPKIGPVMDNAKPRFSRSPRSRASTAARSGPPTHSSGSTRRSNDAPASSGPSPTKPP